MCMIFFLIVHAACEFNDGIMKNSTSELRIVPLIDITNV